MIRHEGENWLFHNASRISNWDPSPLDVIYGLGSVRLGLNFRPISIAASIGNVKLKELSLSLTATSINANYLNDALCSIDSITLPCEETKLWWTYPITLKDPEMERDTFLACMLAEGISVLVQAGTHIEALSHVDVSPASPFVVP